MQRDFGIDCMRVIGLFCIVLAHVSPPYFVFQLRNFDVPLMVFVSGVSFYLSGGVSGSYMNYFVKRLKRLAVPVWIFFTFYFLFFFVIFGASFSVRELLGTFFLTGGIGYVWIIRVFLLMALLAPPVFYLINLFKLKLPFVGLFFILIVQVLSVIFVGYLDDGVGKIFSVLILYTLGYLGVFLFGYWIASVDSKKVLHVLVFVFFVFLICFLANYDGEWVNIQRFKYPPQLMYLSYAMCVSLVLYIFKSSLSGFFYFIKVKGLVDFISGNSIWIYLWHIGFLTLYVFDDNEWALRYISVLFSSIALVYLQVFFVEMAGQRKPSWRQYLGYFKG